MFCSLQLKTARMAKFQFGRKGGVDRRFTVQHASCRHGLAGGGSTITRHRKEQALELARDVIAAHPLAATSGATSPNPQVVLVRVLAPAVEPAMQLLRLVRRAWRVGLWEIEGNEPRIWAM